VEKVEMNGKESNLERERRVTFSVSVERLYPFRPIEFRNEPAKKD